MKESTILSTLAFCLSLYLVITSAFTENISPLSETDINALIEAKLKSPQWQEKISSEIEAQFAKNSAKVKFDKKDKEAIRRELKKELSKTLITDVFKEKLIKASKETNLNQFQEVDVAHLSTVPEKVAYILSKFEDIESYTHDNKVVEQLAELGEDGIDTLLASLTKSGSQWAVKMAANDALSKILTEDHKDIVLEEFKKNGNLLKVISKYQFPEAQEMVMAKLTTSKGHAYLSNDLIDTAFKYDKEEAAQNLIPFIESGNNIAHAAEKILQHTDININQELIIAAKNTNYHWEQSKLAPVLLSQGLNDGFDLAIDILNSDDNNASHSKKSILKEIRRYTKTKGSDADVLDWLLENKDNLQWNGHSYDLN